MVVAVPVQPRGSRSEIQGVRNGRLRTKTTAPPTGGKANQRCHPAAGQGIRRTSVTYCIDRWRSAAQQDFRDFEAGRSAVLAQRDETKFLGSMGSESPDRNTKDQSATIIGVLTNG
ncbi:MAG: hypothetical protein E2O53_00145 [Gammaproteobacteria bacterium]|nr:MAG: hypothetical protein E2O53_00145 [Gammaproteobacteria bacterium]